MPPTIEFSRSVQIAPWPRGAEAVTLEADAAERRALAARFGLEELGSLRGVGRLERAPGGGEIVFEGHVDAEVVQTCVVSLEPVPSTISVAVRRRFVRDAAGPAPAIDHVGADFWDDEVDPLVGDRIDLGEVLAEELGLALPCYPHAVGAAERVDERLGAEVSFQAAEVDETAAPGVSLEELATWRRVASG